MAEARNQTEAQIQFNDAVRNEECGGKKITPYAWISRWQNEHEFGLDERVSVIENAKKAINFKKKPRLINIYKIFWIIGRIL